MVEMNSVIASRCLAGIEFGNTDSVLIIGAVNVADVNVLNVLAYRQKTHSAVAIFGIDAVYGDIGAISAASLVSIDGNKVVVAGALEVADDSEVAVSVEMHAVKIDRVRVAHIVVENYVFNGEI